MTYPAHTVVAILSKSVESENQQIRVALVNYKGKARIDVRLWVKREDWIPSPAGKGLRFCPREIPALCAALNAARARSEGGE